VISTLIATRRRHYDDVTVSVGSRDARRTLTITTLLLLLLALDCSTSRVAYYQRDVTHAMHTT